IAIGWTEADAYSFDGQFEKANELFKKLIADNPDAGGIYLEFAMSNWIQHKYPEMIKGFADAGRLLDDKNLSEFASALDTGFKQSGRVGALRKGADICVAQRNRKTAYVASYFIAELFGDLGEKDQALSWLNIAYQEHDPYMRFLRTDATLNSLRSDPR